MPANEAAAWTEQQTQAAAFRSAVKARSGWDASQRDLTDHQRAVRAAREEAQGSGVVQFSIYVTATATADAGEGSQAEDEASHAGRLARIAASVESAAQHSRLRLRRLYGSQSSGFATTLPCGINPAELANPRRR